MLDGIVVQMVAGEQYTDSGQRPVIDRANLVELRDRASGLVHLPGFQVSLGQQI